MMGMWKNLHKTNPNRHFEVKYVSATQLSLLQIEKIKEAIILYLEPNLKFSF
jgi:hypothetical protein